MFKNHYIKEHLVSQNSPEQKEKEVKKSDNNNVSSLKILGHDLDFEKEKLEYNLNIKDEYALVFEIDLEDAKASYKIEGNEDLKDGSVIKVLSTSESGKTKEYKFIRGFSSISISGICRKLNITRAGIVSGNAKQEDIIKVKEEIEREYAKLYLGDNNE